MQVSCLKNVHVCANICILIPNPVFIPVWCLLFRLWIIDLSPLVEEKLSLNLCSVFSEVPNWRGHYDSPAKIMQTEECVVRGKRILLCRLVCGRSNREESALQTRRLLFKAALDAITRLSIHYLLVILSDGVHQPSDFNWCLWRQ